MALLCYAFFVRCLLALTLLLFIVSGQSVVDSNILNLFYKKNSFFTKSTSLSPLKFISIYLSLF
jgi:hypothetical protein